MIFDQTDVLQVVRLVRKSTFTWIGLRFGSCTLLAAASELQLSARLQKADKHRLQTDDIPLTSAPEEKNLPAPVMTVKTVSGCSFSSRRAAATSSRRFPPNELRDLGRLSYIILLALWHQSQRRFMKGGLALIIPILPLISNTISVYLCLLDVAMAGKY